MKHLWLFSRHNLGRSLFFPFEQLAAFGGFILVFGFFAFNAGSQARISQPGDGAVLGIACVGTIVAASAGALTSMILNNVIIFFTHDSSKWSLLTTLNGALTGMVRNKFMFVARKGAWRSFALNTNLAHSGYFEIAPIIRGHFTQKGIRWRKGRTNLGISALGSEGRVLNLCLSDSEKMCLLQVAICAGCNDYHPWSALVIGILGGAFYLACSWIVMKARIDDPLDAVAGL